MMRASVRRFGYSWRCEVWRLASVLGGVEFDGSELCRSRRIAYVAREAHEDRVRQGTGVEEFGRRGSQRIENMWPCKYAALFDPEIYEVAYRNVRYKARRKKTMLIGLSSSTDNAFFQDTVSRLIQQMKDRSFQFQPIQKEIVRSANGKLVPFGTPSLIDQVIQEALRLIFEPSFVKSRPYEKSARAILARVRNWTGTTWFITASSVGLLDNLDHTLLADRVMRGVKDQQLLDMYWKLVNAGLLNAGNQERHNLTGVSKGGILWSLFTDIYLSDFDEWLKELASTFTNPVQPSHPDHDVPVGNFSGYSPELLGKSTNDKRTRVHYIRYGDQWIVGVDGPKSLAVKFRDKISSYLREELKLETESDGVTITHSATEKAIFLGILIRTRDKKYVESLGDGRAQRVYGRIVLEAPINEIVTKLVEQGFAVNPEWPRGMSAWIHLEAQEILRRYTVIIKSLMEYYCLVDNKNMMRRVFWILRFSAIFTLCRKWRISTRAVFKKLVSNPQYEDFLKGRIVSSSW